MVEEIQKKLQNEVDKLRQDQKGEIQKIFAFFSKRLKMC